jgi:HAD superfamily hydrolase (TIGR01509 family)
VSEEAAAFLRARGRTPGMVIFDCDGVLIDSESLSNRVLAQMLTEDGWPMTEEDADRRFIGISFYDVRPIAEARLGRSLGDDWVDQIVARVVEVMRRDAVPIPGAREALEAVSALSLPWRIASNSSHIEMAAKFGCCGWQDLVAGRMHSAVDIIAQGGKGKPAPDLFVAAAMAEGVAPEQCLVIEDSFAGATAARAASMDCLAFVRHGDGAAMRAAGAVPFASMFDLPALLRTALE